MICLQLKKNNLLLNNNFIIYMFELDFLFYILINDSNKKYKRIL